MENNLGFKELYEVALKATYPIEVNGRRIEIGENIAVFDRVQIANFQEIQSNISARGGKHNPSLVWWEETKEVRINLTQGVFSKTQLALMTNAKLVNSTPNEAILIPKRESLESDEKGILHLSHKPYQDRIFIYTQKDGEKISNYSLQGQEVIMSDTYTDVVVDYEFEKIGKYSTLEIGERLTSGFLSLVGKTRVKDDVSGNVTTGIIRIPKLKLVSGLSMRLGNDAIPIVGTLDLVAIPTGVKGKKKIMDIVFLDEDIDSDL